MTPSNNPLHDKLPELPIDCPEITATADPDAEFQLEDHIDQLPGIDRDRFNHLSIFACQSNVSRNGFRNPNATVLGLADLIRTQAHGRPALHPRVTHIVPLDDIDPLLERVTEILDIRYGDNAYQYPDHLLECRGETVDIEAIYPSEYHIRIADIVRGFRANDILTSVRHPGQSSVSSEQIRSTVEAMDENGEIVNGSVTLHQPENEREPKLYIDGYANHSNPPSEEQLKDLCVTLGHRHGFVLESVEYKNWRGES